MRSRLWHDGTHVAHQTLPAQVTPSVHAPSSFQHNGSPLSSAVRATAAEPALPSLRAHSRDHKEQLGGVAGAAGPSGAEVCVFLDKSMPRARGELPTRAAEGLLNRGPVRAAAAKTRGKQEQRWRQGGRLGAVLHGARCARVARVLQVYFEDRILDVGSAARARAASSARLGPCPGP